MTSISAAAAEGASGEHAVRSLQLSSSLACYAALKAGGVNWAFWQVKRLVCNGARDCFDVIDQCEPCGTIISALEGGQPVGVTRDDGESPPAGSSGVNWDASTRCSDERKGKLPQLFRQCCDTSNAGCGVQWCANRSRMNQLMQ